MNVFRWRRVRPPELADVSLQDLAIAPGHRFLVVAPHCDDEILGAGGLMYAAATAGCAVHVVLLTNGDGYNRAAFSGQSRRRPTAARAIEFAYQRQRETLDALRVLGLDSSSVTFCGYPDRGLAPMWEEHWEANRPYRSRFTGAIRSPFYNSRTPGAIFCGTSLVRDLEQIFEQFQPTHVIVPHPNDSHGDHWASCCFTLYSLERLRLAGCLENGMPVVLQYLVHQGPWPRPRGLHPHLPMQPPMAYTHAQFPWVSLELAREAVDRKHRALLCYRSQMVFMRSYLLSFVRRTELFSLFQPVTPPVVEPGHILVDGDVHDWEGVGGEVLDPVRGSIARRVARSADIKAVAACLDAHNLYLRMELRHRAVNDYVYAIRLHGITVSDDGQVGDRQRLHIGLRAPDRIFMKGDGRWNPNGEIVGRAGYHQLEVAIPLRLLDYPERIFLGVATRYRGLVIDRKALQVLHLSQR